MLDTVRLSVQVPEVSSGDLLRRGWDVYTRTNAVHGQGDVWAACVLDGVRLGYMAGLRWLTAEASLPAVISGDNAELLDWQGCQAGLDFMRGAAADAAGAKLPGLDDWRVTRADAVWAWPVNPSPYIAALRFSRLPRTQARGYETSVDWVTSQGHRIRCRFYDKSAEAGHRVQLPSRLERQVRPRREVVRVQGERLGCGVQDLDAVAVRAVLEATMGELGLDKPIPTVLGVRERLIEAHGRRRGQNLFRVLLEARAFGGWPGDVPKQTLRRYQRQLAEAGVKAVSLDAELPGLSVENLS
jgi:hypothetical protein